MNTSLEKMLDKIRHAKMVIQEEMYKGTSPVVLGAILECLTGMEQSLVEQAQITDVYRGWDFGLYRIFSDSGPLEETEAGRVIHALMNDLYYLSKDI